jgi:quinoprotein glucose dehydrogenase
VRALSRPGPAAASEASWGTIAAVDLKAGKIVWTSTRGSTEEIAPFGLDLGTGTPNVGGPLATAGGLVFIGAAMDRYLRAFDAVSGKELWQGRLPATAQATPMTYEWQGRQYVVVAAGGHGQAGTAPGDSFVAFALPREGEPGPTWWSRHIDRPGARMWIWFSVLAIALLFTCRSIISLLRWRRRITSA